MSLFRPPIVRSAAAALDRSLFSKTIPVAAVRILDRTNISRIRSELHESKDALFLDRFQGVQLDPEPELAAEGGKCLLLNPDIQPEDPSTWSEVLKEAAKKEDVQVIHYDLKLDYDYWQYLDIMQSILPEEAHREIPVGFTAVGHVAHVNLKDEYLPYKHVIAQVIADKNPGVRTVINKTDLVGTRSEFRTFGYEVLLGPDDMNVEVNQTDCIFKFDWSKVYWNSRLETEHRRLVDMFQPGEVVCDVMAGIGPFAIPAGKKGVFVYANDLNPESYKCLEEGIRRNKVTPFVRSFKENGHTFIRRAADDLLSLSATGKNIVKIMPKHKPTRRSVSPSKIKPQVHTLKHNFSHFVMNLPASAITFLPSFIGLYHGYSDSFSPSNKLPMIHVHCFSSKGGDHGREICERISEQLDFKIELGEQEMVVHHVRDVAPNKKMFCASFRLPAEVAFAERGPIGPRKTEAVEGEDGSEE